jgi:predicted phage baseplate assembly protein
VPLPLPDLDDRGFADLVAEALVTIPRHAPEWTDHNASDPGITLVELLAWLVEQELYRVNRVPERHRRKFLALVGHRPRPPRPARVVVAFAPAAGGVAVSLPAGIALAAAFPGAAPIPFRTLAPLAVGTAALAAVQVDGPAGPVDRTREWRERRPFPALGEAPDAEGAALLAGFDRPLPAGVELSLWAELAGVEAGAAARAALEREAAGVGAGAPDPARHHAVRLAWEAWDGTGWVALEADDETRGLGLSGAVRLRPAADVPLAAVGAVAEQRAWVRCRAAAGPFDAAPVVARLAAHAVACEQRRAARQVHALAPAAAPPPAPGAAERALAVAPLPGTDTLAGVAETAADEAPRAVVLAAAAAEVEMTLVRVGTGTGLAGQHAVLGAAVADGALRLWTVGPDGTPHRWSEVADLDAAGPVDRVFTLAAGAGVARFGDGRRGAPPEAGAALFAAWDETHAGAGTPSGSSRWLLHGADDPVNAVVLAEPVADVAVRLPAIEPVAVVRPGGDEEDVRAAAGRAAEELWAHERLVELATAAGRSSLDRLPRAIVLDRPRPARGATLLDLERLALDVPGAPVARARAFAELDPAVPCARAAGTVTLVVLPWLPRGRPVPSAPLLAAIRRSLALRRTLCTRLLVTGPDYVDVDVAATLHAATGADPARLATDARRALQRHLDPLRGGPDGGGWPFGRDLFAAELLAVLEAVPGVDHVDGLALHAVRAGARCDDLCLPSLGLPALGRFDAVVA